MGELNVYRQLGIKPNFTQIGRRYGLHRQTVAKYWRRGGEGDVAAGAVPQPAWGGGEQKKP